MTDANGLAEFQTIYPGWYRGRAVHIHMKVHVGGSVVHTGQLFFDDDLTDQVYRSAPYSSRVARDVRNTADDIYRSAGAASARAARHAGRPWVHGRDHRRRQTHLAARSAERVCDPSADLTVLSRGAHLPRASVGDIVRVKTTGYMGLAAAIALTALAAGAGAQSSAGASADPSSGIHKIKHVVVIMQENRSFDSYFGTFPGADGIPMTGGNPSVCAPDPATGNCVAPFADNADVNGGGPHNYSNATSDINGGKMDGFIGQAESGKKGCADPTDPACTNSATPDVMGYHTGSDIPNYWAYAKNFVLQDHMFEPNASWSLPAHLFTVSEWAVAPRRQPLQLRERHPSNPPANPRSRRRSTAARQARRNSRSRRRIRATSPSTPGRT